MGGAYFGPIVAIRLRANLEAHSWTNDVASGFRVGQTYEYVVFVVHWRSELAVARGLLDRVARQANQLSSAAAKNISLLSELKSLL